MRHPYCSVTPALVRATAAHGLGHALPWVPYRRRVRVAALLDLVLLVASLASSLWAVVRRFAFGFSHETARQALYANLPKPAALADGLVDALHGYLPHGFHRRSWDVALDLHYAPFYGRRRTRGTVGGPKKGGSNRFYAYATAVVVQAGQRWCLGLVCVTACRWERVVEQLLQQLAARHIRVCCLLLDRGFFSGHVIRALQARGVPFVLGVPRKGGRLDQLFNLPSGTVRPHTWKTERGAWPVTVSMVAVRRRVRGQWRRELYAFAGVSPDGAVSRWQRARYYARRMRQRFGIETSYRQLNQGKAMTTAKEVGLRLLWVGVALLLRQVWVYLQRTLAGPRRNWQRWRPDERLRLQRMLAWLAGELTSRHPEARHIPLPKPLDLSDLGFEKC